MLNPPSFDDALLVGSICDSSTLGSLLAGGVAGKVR